MPRRPTRESTRPLDDDDIDAGFPPRCPSCLRAFQPVGGIHRASWACAGCGLHRIA